MFTGAASVPEELATSRRSRCSSCAASCSTTSEPAHRSRRTSRRGRRPRASWLCPPSSSRRGDPFPSCFRCRASTCCSRLLGPSSVGGDVRQPSRANGLLAERYGCGSTDLLRGRQPNSWGPIAVRWHAPAADLLRRIRCVVKTEARLNESARTHSKNTRRGNHQFSAFSQRSSSHPRSQYLWGFLNLNFFLFQRNDLKFILPLRGKKK